MMESRTLLVVCRNSERGNWAGDKGGAKPCRIRKEGINLGYTLSSGSVFISIRYSSQLFFQGNQYPGIYPSTWPS